MKNLFLGDTAKPEFYEDGEGIKIIKLSFGDTVLEFICYSNLLGNPWGEDLLLHMANSQKKLESGVLDTVLFWEPFNPDMTLFQRLVPFLEWRVNRLGLSRFAQVARAVPIGFTHFNPVFHLKWQRPKLYARLMRRACKNLVTLFFVPIRKLEAETSSLLSEGRAVKPTPLQEELDEVLYGYVGDRIEMTLPLEIGAEKHICSYVVIDGTDRVIRKVAKKYGLEITTEPWKRMD